MTRTRHWLPVVGAALTFLLLKAPPASAFGCIVSASPITFDSYNPLSRNDVATVAFVTYSCSGGKYSHISIGLTRGHSSSFAQREMRDGARGLHYNLYLDPSGTRIWGDGTEGTVMYVAPAPPNGQNITVPVYGRIPPSQNVSAGHYGDNVAVILNF